jgi:hypothetical protein
MPDIILEGDHLRIISAKFGWDWLNSFRGEDFVFNFIPLFLISAWWPSWLEVGITGHNFGRGPYNDYSIKFGSNWATGSRQDGFYVNFPLGSMLNIKYSCAAILVRGRDHHTQFWKRTIQWLFHRRLVPIEQLVPDKKIFMWISHRVLG